MTEDKILQKIEELRKTDDNSLCVVCNIILNCGKEYLEQSLKNKDFFKDKEKYSQETIDYYKEQHEKSEKIYFLLKAISQQIMMAQKENWVPLNKLIKELYDLRREGR